MLLDDLFDNDEFFRSEFQDLESQEGDIEDAESVLIDLLRGRGRGRSSANRLHRTERQ